MFLEKVAKFEVRYDELSDLLSREDVASNQELLQKYGREQSSLQDIVDNYRELRNVMQQIVEAEQMIGTSQGADIEELAPGKNTVLDADNSSECAQAHRKRDIVG